MTLIDWVAIVALAAVAAYIHFLGRGERGEAFSPAWPVNRAQGRPGDPVDEGADVPADDGRMAPEVPRKAA